MDIDTDDLIDIIDELSVTKQQELLSRLTYQVERHGTSSFKVEHRHAWQALCSASDDSKHVPPITTFATTYGKAKLIAAFDRLNDFATASCGKTLMLPERLAVLNLIVECLAEHLRSVETVNRKRMVIRPASLIGNLGSMVMAVDMCFPGYASSKVLERAALLKSAA